VSGATNSDGTSLTNSGYDTYLTNYEAANNGKIYLQTGGANTRMTLDSAGKVGIGKTPEDNALEVSGRIGIEAANAGVWIASDLTGSTEDGWLNYLATADLVWGLYTGGSYSEKMRITSAGMALIGDTTNANMTVGLTINQGGNDDEILDFKTSDCASGGHALVSIAETDTYFRMGKNSATLGGIAIRSIADDGATSITTAWESYGGTANTTKTNAGALGLFDIYLAEHDGANAQADITADGNIFSIRARVGSAAVARLVVDEDGQLHLTNTTLVALSDDKDDVGMIRAFETARHEHGAKGYIQNKWDEFVTHNEQDLVDAGILGDTIENGGMWNMNRHMMMMNGALWQTYTKLMDMAERIEENVPQLKGKLLPQLGA